jgi:hypothetical protein
VPEGEAAFTEEPFRGRTGQTGADFGLPGDLVEVVQVVEPAQIQRDHGGELAADGVQSADNAGSAAERDDGDAVLGAVGEQRGDLVLVRGQQDRVRCVLTVDLVAAQQIQGRLAARMKKPRAVVGEAVLRTDDLRQAVEIGSRQSRRLYRHLVEGGLGARRRVDAESLFEQAPDTGGQWLGFRGIAPGIPLHRRQE